MAPAMMTLLIAFSALTMTAAIPFHCFHDSEAEHKDATAGALTHVLDISEIDIQNLTELALNKALLLKGGAVGAATKGLLLAKKGAYVAGRIILKPLAVITGLHLKLIGSGLTFGGKLVGGTGAGIAKTGTVVKYTGLGAIGLGASAVGWGLDKSTIDTHIESHADIHDKTKDDE